MVKFLVSRDLLFLVDFTSSATNAIQDFATVDIGHIIATLKQCPSYQIDKNHTNCGLRTRILPILEYIQSMLSSNVVSIARPAWIKDRATASWYPADDADDKRAPTVFRFTRAMVTDHRLRYEGAMAADRMAKALFTSDQWDWTPEDGDETPAQELWKWR